MKYIEQVMHGRSHWHSLVGKATIGIPVGSSQLRGTEKQLYGKWSEHGDCEEMQVTKEQHATKLPT